MIYISNKGNLFGPDPQKENLPEYVDEAINAGFQVKVDLWISDDRIFLGDGYPKYKIDLAWLINRYLKLWIQCKNASAVSFMQEHDHFHYFWNYNDSITLTSLKYVWASPYHPAIKKSIVVSPNIIERDFSEYMGICSDFIADFKK